MSGTINISRDLWDDTAFAHEPFSEREAWVWMIAEASWKARARRVGDYVVSLERGQLAHSTRFMAETFGWTHSKARRFLDRLERLGMIERKTGTGVSVITICNYDKYQSQAQASGTGPAQVRHTSGTNEKKGEIRDIDTLEGKPSNDAAASVDPAKLMFDSGVALLSAAGIKRAQARAMIGKWRKDHGAEAVIAAIGRAQREGAVDPVAFIVGALRFSAKAAEPKPGDCRVLGNGQKQVFQAGNGWMTEHV